MKYLVIIGCLMLSACSNQNVELRAWSKSVVVLMNYNFRNFTDCKDMGKLLSEKNEDTIYPCSYKDQQNLKDEER